LAKGKGVFSARLSAGVIIFGVIAIITIAIYYYYNYYPIRPFYPPPPTAGKLDKFGIKEIYLSKRGGEEWYLNTEIPRTAHEPEERDRRPRSCKKTTMVAGKYKVVKCVMVCSLRQVIIQI